MHGGEDLNKRKSATIYHSDLFGLRQAKYMALMDGDTDRTDWKEVHPDGPWYLFKPIDKSLFGEYSRWMRLNEVFPVNSVGIVTARDRLTIHFTPEDVWETVHDFVSLSPEEARRKYALGQDARDWKVEWAQADLRKDRGPLNSRIVPILYRPFDVRYTYFTGRSRGFICMPREAVMRQMLQGNVALIATRLTKDDWDCFIAKHAAGHKSCAAYDVNSVFPLYLYPSGGLDPETKRRPNICSAFLAGIASTAKLQFAEHAGEDSFTADDVLHYAYAVFRSLTYRIRYQEFLAIDFPRLPLPGSAELFRQLAALGAELTALHLPERAGPNRPNYPVAGPNTVEKVTYEEKEQRVWINKSQCFAPVAPDVWEFHIGGYQVCEKWLKDRKGRKLSNDDLEHYRRIVANLAETIDIMSEIDSVIEWHGGWPGAFLT